MVDFIVAVTTTTTIYKIDACLGALDLLFVDMDSVNVLMVCMVFTQLLGRNFNFPKKFHS